MKKSSRGTYWEGSYDAYVNVAHLLPNGNVVIAGWRNIKVKNGKKQEKEAFVAELRRNGSVIWSRTYGNNSVATGLTIAKNGDLFVVGYTIKDRVSSEGWIMKLSPSGEVLWCKAYDNVMKASHVMAYKYRNLMTDNSVMVYGMKFYADAVPTAVGVDGKGNVVVGGNLRNLVLPSS